MGLLGHSRLRCAHLILSGDRRVPIAEPYRGYQKGIDSAHRSPGHVARRLLRRLAAGLL